MIRYPWKKLDTSKILETFKDIKPTRKSDYMKTISMGTQKHKQFRSIETTAQAAETLKRIGALQPKD